MNQTLTSPKRLGRDFLRTVPGRLATFTGGLMLFGMGAVALYGDGPYVLYLISAFPLASILLGIFTVGYSILEGNDEATTAIILSFPFLAGLGLAGLYSAPPAGVAMAVVFLVLGGLVMGASVHVARPVQVQSEAEAHA